MSPSDCDKIITVGVNSMIHLSVVLRGGCATGPKSIRKVIWVTRLINIHTTQNECVYEGLLTHCFLQQCAVIFSYIKLYFVSVLAYEDSGKKGHGSVKSDKLLKRGFKNWEER